MSLGGFHRNQHLDLEASVCLPFLPADPGEGVSLDSPSIHWAAGRQGTLGRGDLQKYSQSLSLHVLNLAG